MIEVTCQQDLPQGNEILCISISGMKVMAFGDDVMQLGPHCLRISQESLTVEQVIQLNSLMKLFENTRPSTTGNAATTDQMQQLQTFMGLFNDMNWTGSNKG